MKVLVFAPHPDDEVLGVGGTIAKRTLAGDTVRICVVTRGAEPLYTKEAADETIMEASNADRILGVSRVTYLNFPAAMLDMIPAYKINGDVAKVVREFQPDEVYIPHRGDMHLDHKIVADAVMVAVRPKGKHIVKRVYSYETMSETGWDAPNQQNEFIPNVFEDITSTLRQKAEALEIIKSQMAEFPAARSIYAVTALAMYRGAVVNCEAAEAFMLIREVKEESLK